MAAAARVAAAAGDAAAPPLVRHANVSKSWAPAGEGVAADAGPTAHAWAWAAPPAAPPARGPPGAKVAKSRITRPTGAEVGAPAGTISRVRSLESKGAAGEDYGEGGDGGWRERRWRMGGARAGVRSGDLSPFSLLTFVSVAGTLNACPNSYAAYPLVCGAQACTGGPARPRFAAPLAQRMLSGPAAGVHGARVWMVTSKSAFKVLPLPLRRAFMGAG